MPEAIFIPIYIFTFLYGLVIGSFLNVVIYRVPKHENIVNVRSHCMKCDYRLRWYDLIPLFSYIFLRGKCRNCGEKISLQYPVIECVNGLIWLFTVLINGINVKSLLFCLTFSALLSLSIIDFRTFEIPIGFNIFIASVGVINLILDKENFLDYIIGAVSVSGFLLIIYIITKGGGIGGGDVKLMAAAGFLLGWQNIVLSLCIGCVAGAIIHLIRMKFFKAGRVLAMGPYLSIGIFISALFGKTIISAYLSLFTF